MKYKFTNRKIRTDPHQKGAGDPLNVDPSDTPGAQHSFTNPAADMPAKKFNLPLGYNAEADRESWHKLHIFC